MFITVIILIDHCKNIDPMELKTCICAILRLIAVLYLAFLWQSYSLQKLSKFLLLTHPWRIYISYCAKYQHIYFSRWCTCKMRGIIQQQHFVLKISPDIKVHLYLYYRWISDLTLTVKNRNRLKSKMIQCLCQWLCNLSQNVFQSHTSWWEMWCTLETVPHTCSQKIWDGMLVF